MEGLVGKPIRKAEFRLRQSKKTDKVFLEDTQLAGKSSKCFVNLNFEPIKYNRSKTRLLANKEILKHIQFLKQRLRIMAYRGEIPHLIVLEMIMRSKVMPGSVYLKRASYLRIQVGNFLRRFPCTYLKGFRKLLQNFKKQLKRSFRRNYGIVFEDQYEETVVISDGRENGDDPPIISPSPDPTYSNTNINNSISRTNGAKIENEKTSGPQDISEPNQIQKKPLKKRKMEVQNDPQSLQRRRQAQDTNEEMPEPDIQALNKEYFQARGRQNLSGRTPPPLTDIQMYIDLMSESKPKSHEQMILLEQMNRMLDPEIKEQIVQVYRKDIFGTFQYIQELSIQNAINLTTNNKVEFSNLFPELCTITNAKMLQSLRRYPEVIIVYGVDLLKDKSNIKKSNMYLVLYFVQDCRPKPLLVGYSILSTRDDPSLLAQGIEYLIDYIPQQMMHLVIQPTNIFREAAIHLKKRHPYKKVTYLKDQVLTEASKNCQKEFPLEPELAQEIMGLVEVAINSQNANEHIEAINNLESRFQNFMGQAEKLLKTLLEYIINCSNVNMGTRTLNMPITKDIQKTVQNIEKEMKDSCSGSKFVQHSFKVQKQLRANARKNEDEEADLRMHEFRPILLSLKPTIRALVQENIKRSRKFKIEQSEDKSFYIVHDEINKLTHKVKDGWCDCIESPHTLLPCPHLLSVARYLRSIQIACNAVHKRWLSQSQIKIDSDYVMESRSLDGDEFEQEPYQEIQNPILKKNMSKQRNYKMPDHRKRSLNLMGSRKPENQKPISRRQHKRQEQRQARREARRQARQQYLKQLQRQLKLQAQQQLQAQSKPKPKNQLQIIDYERYELRFINQLTSILIDDSSFDKTLHSIATNIYVDYN